MADYSNTLPNSADRAGAFQPTTSSLWDRVFHPSSPATHPLFPSTSDDLKAPLSSSPSLSPVTRSFSAQKIASPGPDLVFWYEKKPGTLRKPSDRPLAHLLAFTHTHSAERAKSPGLGRGGCKREAVKFRPLRHSEGLSSDDEDDDETKIDDALSMPPPKRRFSHRSASSKQSTSSSGTRAFSGSTKLESGKGASRYPSPEDTTEFHREIEQNRVLDTRSALDDEPIPEYFDRELEEDVTTESTSRPDVLGRSRHSIAGHYNDNAEVIQSSIVPIPDDRAKFLSPRVGSAGAVPMTQSLMYAFERVALARRDALLKPNPETEPLPGLPPAISREATLIFPKARKDQRWESFWKDVTRKAGKSVQR